MFIAHSTKDGIFFTAHETAEAAVTHLINSLTDTNDDFWASADGKSIVRSSRMVDYDLQVFPSVAAAVDAMSDQDPEVLASSLRAIADAVEEFEAMNA